MLNILPRSNAMSTEILCPKPQRFHKRVLADIDSDALPVSKLARRSPPPLPTPSTHGQRSETSHPPPRPSPQASETSILLVRLRRSVADCSRQALSPTATSTFKSLARAVLHRGLLARLGANIVAYSFRLTRQSTLGSPQSSVQELVQSVSRAIAHRLVQLPLTSTKPSVQLRRLQRSSKCHNYHPNMERM